MRKLYRPEPLNQHGDVRDIARQEAQSVLMSQSLIGVVQPGSMPQGTEVRPFVTDLPVTAVDGDEVRLLADDANGVVWHLRYRAGAPSDYRWEFIGGAPLTSRVDDAETTTSATYDVLGTPGPSVAVPLSGDYIVRISSNTFNSGVATNYHSYDVGATAAVDSDGIEGAVPSASYSHPGFAENRHNGMTAGDEFTSMYKTTAGTATFRYRWMSVIPVRVGRD